MSPAPTMKCLTAIISNAYWKRGVSTAFVNSMMWKRALTNFKCKQTVNNAENTIEITAKSNK